MNNKTLYVTYKQYGTLKRGILSQTQYEKYQKDPSITELQLHASQGFMENYYSEATGKPKSTKQLLYG